MSTWTTSTASVMELLGGDVWVDRNGQERHVQDMPWFYRMSVIRFLKRRAQLLACRALERDERVLGLATACNASVHTLDRLGRHCDDMAYVASSPQRAMEWLMGQHLMYALQHPEESVHSS